MKHAIQILLASCLLPLFVAQSGFGAVILTTDPPWTRFSYSFADMEASQDNRVYAFPTADISTGRVNDGNDVVSFTVPNGLWGVIEVTDIGVDGDRYSLLDFNNSLALLGSTSALAQTEVQHPSADANAEGHIDLAYASADWSSGQFGGMGDPMFPAGAHNVKIRALDTALDQGTVGGLAIRFRVIPEPSSALMGMLGLAACLLRRRRR